MYEMLALARRDELDRELAAVATIAGADPDRPDPFARLRRRPWWVRLLGPRPQPASRHATTGVTIRAATEGDAATLATLAVLDDRTIPRGEVLVAELDDRIVAALPLDGPAVLTDPWREVADLVELLQLRSEQLRLARRTRAAA